MTTEDLYNTGNGRFTAEEKNVLKSYTPENKYSEEETRRLIEDVDTKVTTDRKTFKLIRYLKALKNYLIDKDVKWYKKSIVIGALIYFISPIDTIPDIAPILGYLDDLGVLTWTVKFLGDELKTRI